MDKVCILLSTFNGKQYLKEQLDSLINQINVDIFILARDDGSSDGTIEILKEYSAKYDFFTFYQGDNVKPARSFLDLMKSAPQADFYAFSDQDDVWDDDKLSVAVNMLKKENGANPNMYYSNLRIVDEHLNYYRLSHQTPHIQKNRYSPLVEDFATGCTIVFNKAALDYAKKANCEYCSMHDSWMYMICNFFGKIIYDFDAHISYRQHGNNVVGTYLQKRTISLYWKRFKRLFNRKLQPRYNNAISFYAAFKDFLQPTDKEKIEKIVNYKRSRKDKKALLKDKDICGSSKGKNFRYRMLVRLGIV